MTRVFMEACQMLCISQCVPVEMHFIDKNLSGLHNKRLTFAREGRLGRRTMMYRGAGTCVWGGGGGVDKGFK